MMMKNLANENRDYGLGYSHLGNPNTHQYQFRLDCLQNETFGFQLLRLKVQGSNHNNIYSLGTKYATFPKKKKKKKSNKISMK